MLVCPEMQVSTIYLFHELPKQAREDAVAEMVRVLKPGGLLVFNDGTQLGDRPINDKTQGNFEAFNEVFHSAPYCETDTLSIIIITYMTSLICVVR